MISRWRNALLGSTIVAVGMLATLTATTPTASAAPATVGCPGLVQKLCDAGGLLFKSGMGLTLADDAAKAGAGGSFDALADGAFGAMAAKFGEAGVGLLESLAHAVVDSSAVDLAGSGVEPVVAITLPIAMLAAVVLMVVAAAKAAVRGSGSVLGTALVGLGKTVLVSILLVAVVQMALKATDALTDWIIARSLGGNPALEHRLATLINLESLESSAALVLVFGFLAVVVGLVLWVELLFRQVAIMVLVAVAAIAATGLILDETSEWWTKTRNALIQLIVLKPVIALCFAVGFSTFGASRDLVGVIAGFATLLLACFAWPLLARFMTFTTAGGGSGAVAGLLAGAGGVLTGRRLGLSGPPSGGPHAVSGTGYTQALERQNDQTTAATGTGGGWSPSSGFAGTRGSGMGGGMAGGMGRAAGVAGAVVGVAAAATAAAVNHAAGQMSAGADSGLHPGGTGSSGGGRGGRGWAGGGGWAGGRRTGVGGGFAGRYSGPGHGATGGYGTNAHGPGGYGAGAWPAGGEATVSTPGEAPPPPETPPTPPPGPAPESGPAGRDDGTSVSGGGRDE